MLLTQSHMKEEFNINHKDCRTTNFWLIRNSLQSVTSKIYERHPVICTFSLCGSHNTQNAMILFVINSDEMFEEINQGENEKIQEQI